jgi:hypothetical protein
MNSAAASLAAILADISIFSKFQLADSPNGVEK